VPAFQYRQLRKTVKCDIQLEGIELCAIKLKPSFWRKLFRVKLMLPFPVMKAGTTDMPFYCFHISIYNVLLFKRETRLNKIRIYFPGVRHKRAICLKDTCYVEAFVFVAVPKLRNGKLLTGTNVY
jgi:hypothetical protein